MRHWSLILVKSPGSLDVLVEIEALLRIGLDFSNAAEYIHSSIDG